MREDIEALIRSRKHCALATAAANKPYCSLMAYTAPADCSRIWMATFRNTRKFRNMKENPKVSLLIDARDAEQAQALTLEGCFQEITGESEIKEARERLLADHPEMEDFLDQPDTAFVCIRLQSLVFLNGLTDVYRERLA
jgi:nitroimidazol reductase NimA-like FMN-containing flavoprotein (pyridoxamine 5'-phosphate oxidase superfamily)